MRNRSILIRAFIATILLPAITMGMAAAPATRAPRSDWTTTQTLWDSGPYVYDAAGHVKSIGADVYRYDKAGRLIFATAGTAPPAPGQLPANQQEFEYDRYGNLTSMLVTTAQEEARRHGFAVDEATNRLGHECSEPVDGCFTGFYDAATGNQLGRLSANEYVWDPLGMLAELHTSRRERYIYDANDERILVVDQVTGSERYALRNPAANVTRELTRTPTTNAWRLDKDYVHRGTTLIASFSGTEIAPDRHYHVDHLGSTRLVTDGSGNRRAIHTYWPFGPEAAGSETDAERLKFTGHERDSSPATSPGVDLDYMHARYYDANAGRFLSVDPYLDLHKATRNPQNWNRYSYVRNNPINLVDPDGRDDVNIGPDFEVAGAPGSPEKHKEVLKSFAQASGGLISVVIATVVLDAGPEIDDGELPKRPTKPTLPNKTLATDGKVTIEHYYRSQDHPPAHAHVRGGGPDTRIGPNGKPATKSDAPMTREQQRVYDANKSRVRRAINKIGRWLASEIL